MLNVTRRIPSSCESSRKSFFSGPTRDAKKIAKATHCCGVELAKVDAEIVRRHTEALGFSSVYTLVTRGGVHERQVVPTHALVSDLATYFLVNSTEAEIESWAKCGTCGGDHDARTTCPFCGR
jgi:hypothetical protein